MTKQDKLNGGGSFFARQVAPDCWPWQISESVRRENFKFRVIFRLWTRTGALGKGHRGSDGTPSGLIRSWCSPDQVARLSSLTKRFDSLPVLFVRCISGSWRNHWKRQNDKEMGRLVGCECALNLKGQDYTFIIPFGLSGIDFRKSRSI